VKKNKHCKTCGKDIISNEDRDSLRFTNDWQQVMAKSQCDDHEKRYSNHKCRPHWCGDCGFLIKYEITLTEHINKTVGE
tara:strand:- start:4576 stop:4812 length:237 start_codon:yes stop_codon:yes gene_type:complete